MNACLNGKILPIIIMGGILILTSCGVQERGDVQNSAENGKITEYAQERPSSYDFLGRPIHTDTIGDTQTDIPPLYAAFLRGEISVPNPFVPGSELSFFDDRKYAQVEHVFEYAAKSFSLVDVNGDGVSELIFRMYSSPDELMYILGIQGDRLACYDVQETHTTHMAFQIYDNGIVMWGQNYDGEEKIYYSYDEDGKPYELIHFVREETEPGSGLYYDWYYRDGDETAKCALSSDEEYEALISSYEGGQPEWFSCDSFADIPVE